MKFVPFLAATIASLGFVSAVSAQNATLSVLHGVPGLAGPVEVFANGSSLFTFDYGDQRGPLSVPPGPLAVDIRLNGSSILSANVMLAADTNYTAIANLDAMGTPGISLFTNDTSMLSLPESRLIVRHTAQAPSVDVQLRQGSNLVATLAGLTNGNSQQADVSPGTYSATLVVSSSQATAFGPAELALEDGYAYAVYAVGTAGSPDFRLIVQRIDLAARVSVIHGIPGLPAPVDVLAGGQVLFSFDFAESRGPLVLNPGTYPLAVRLQGQIVLSANATVAAGDNVTVVAHLDAMGGNVLSTFANDVSSSNGQCRVTVRHTAAAPPVDVGVDAIGQRITTITNVTNGQSRTLDAPAALYEAVLFAAGTNNVAFGPEFVNTVVDTSYLIYAIGDLNAGTFQLFLQTIDLGAAVPGDLGTMTGGTSCGPQIGASSSSFDFGDHFFVTVSGGMADGAAMIMVGDSIMMSGSLALPFDLGAIGAPGCFLNTNLVATRPLVLDATGSAALPFVVPTTVFGNLQPLYFQYATLSNSNALGLESTDYLELSAN